MITIWSMQEKDPQRRIFVVDDDAAIREVLTLMIHDAGYMVEAFESGHAMLKLLEKPFPSAILLDYFLPGEVTDDIIQKIVEKDVPISIILMSADMRTSKISENLPVHAFLQKPFQMDTVFDILASYT